MVETREVEDYSVFTVNQYAKELFKAYMSTADRKIMTLQDVEELSRRAVHHASIALRVIREEVNSGRA